MSDNQTSSRKKDHIQLAFESQADQLNNWFHYEPMLAAHPNVEERENRAFANGNMNVPVWVSSMTGGTELAKTINHNLARACGEFGMGMGLGSCRILMDDPSYYPDFQVRQFMPDQPLYANLGIAQLEEYFNSGRTEAVRDMVSRLEATGLIIHVNPLQEWAQPEGDRFQEMPINTIKRCLDEFSFPIIVKEVGQGFGPASMRALLDLPLEAIDFGAYGGTNFTKLEALRDSGTSAENNRLLATIGHTAEEMVEFYNGLGSNQTKQVIISGGVSSFLHGYYLIQKINALAVYGQASAFLKHAQGPYEDLAKYVQEQVEGLAIAKAYLQLKQ